MYRLVKIHELPEELATGPGHYTAIDVPDLDSPTGYTTKRILTSLLVAIGNQDLETTLGYGSTTGLNRLLISDRDAPLTFVDKVNLTRTELVQAEILSDIAVNLPSENGTLQLEYDSGTKQIPIYNGAYGLANTGNPLYRPTIRVIGRTVHVDGLLLLPMPTVAGGVILDTNGPGYVLQAKNYGDLYTGAGDGYEINAKNNALSWSPILPTALRPYNTVRFLSEQPITRTLNIPGGRIRLAHYLQAGALLTDGRILFNGIETSERNGDVGVGWNKNLHQRKIVDRFQTNDSLLIYDNYYNSFDNAGVVDKRVMTLEGYKYTFDFDGTQVNDLGGMFVALNFTYDLDPALTLNQIKTAFDSL